MGGREGGSAWLSNHFELDGLDEVGGGRLRNVNKGAGCFFLQVTSS